MKKSLFISARYLLSFGLVVAGTLASAQTSYTFTPAGATGSLGPTQSDVNTAYASTNLSGSVIVNPQGIQNFTIPITGDYRIEARGAQGYGTYGGRGAIMIGDFNLTAGTVLKVLVGQTAIINNTSYSNQFGGGGGSFITYTNNTPLVVAGGGGGSHSTTGFSANADGTVSTTGNDGANGTTNAAGGSSGSGGSSAGNLADGGGGLLGDGAGTYAGGLAFVNGGTGGGYRGIGGFGGGAGTGSFNDTRGGGGGGYSGGGGSHQSGSTGFPVAGGGGSYNNGSNQQNTSGANLGDGLVIITRLCDVVVNASTNPICFGSAVTLSTNAGSNVSWSTGGTSNSISVSPSVTTSYTVSGVSSSSTACSSTLAITVTVNPLPNITAATLPTVLCVGSTGTIYASGAVAYTFNPGNSSGSSTTVSPVTSSIYTVTGESLEGCRNTQTVLVNVNSNQLSLSPDTTICQGEPVSLRVQGAQNVLWSNGAPFNNVLAYPGNNTTYTVGGTDVYGCYLTGAVNVTVNLKPAVTASATRSVVCIDEPMELNAGGAVSYQWSNGSTGSSINPIAPVEFPQSFTVTGTDHNGCKNSATVSVIVEKCTGIAEKFLHTLHLYPNPATNQVLVRASSAIKQVTIYDVRGTVAQKVTGNFGELLMDLEPLSAGLYYVEIKTLNSSGVEKLIKY